MDTKRISQGNANFTNQLCRRESCFRSGEPALSGAWHSRDGEEWVLAIPALGSVTSSTFGTGEGSSMSFVSSSCSSSLWPRFDLV